MADQEFSFATEGTRSVEIEIEGAIPNDFHGPVTLFTLVDGCVVGRDKLDPGPFKIHTEIPIPAGNPSFRLSFQTDKPININDQAGRTVAHLAVPCSSATFINDMVPVYKSEEGKQQQGAVTACHVNLEKPASVQLPQFFYPDMLDVKIDGRPVSYYPTLTKRYHMPGDDLPYVLAGVDVPAGEHVITTEYRGLVWANWLSAISWLAWVVLAVTLSVTDYWKHVVRRRRQTISAR